MNLESDLPITRGLIPPSHRPQRSKWILFHSDTGWYCSVRRIHEEIRGKESRGNRFERQLATQDPTDFGRWSDGFHKVQMGETEESRLLTESYEIRSVSLSLNPRNGSIVFREVNCDRLYDGFLGCEEYGCLVWRSE